MSVTKQTALDNLLKKFKEVVKDYKEDPRLVKVFDEMKKTSEAFRGVEDPRGIQALFEERRYARGIISKNVSNEHLIVLKKYFDNLEIAALIGSNIHNVTERIRQAYLVKTDGGKGKKGKSDDEIRFSDDPAVAHMQALDMLNELARQGDGSEKDDANRLKALALCMQYGEGQVLALLKDKYATLEQLGKFFISTLIPLANKKIREAVREITGKSDIDPVDLRIIFRDLLPSVPELKGRLEKYQWLEEEAKSEKS